MLKGIKMLFWIVLMWIKNDIFLTDLTNKR